MTRLRTTANDKGFTLLEVLVATVILGTAVAALLGLLSGSVGNASRLEAAEQALLLGQSKMNELLAAGLDSGDAASSGTEGRETAPMPLDQTIRGRWDGRFRWEALATRARSAAVRTPGETILVRLQLDVFWRPASEDERSGNERKISFETLQLRLEPIVAAQ